LFKVGIDLGGTKTEVILLDPKLNVLQRKRVPTPNQNYEKIIKTISDLIGDVTQNISNFTVGVCTPGAISKQTGLIKNSNTQCLIGKPFQDDLKKILKKDILIENDANCFTMAESLLGSARDFDTVFGIIMGTGVGGGIVYQKKLLVGRTNIAGEWGHHTLIRNGNPCYCGKHGCVETYLSGPALESSWKKLSGYSKPMHEIIRDLDGPSAEIWKNDFLENFGYALANVIDILDPDVIVLGGGLSNIDFLYDEGKKSVYEKVFSDIVDTPIIKNELGDSAGVIGAALLW
jgi:fructokinase